MCGKIEGADEQALDKWEEVQAQIQKEEDALEDDLFDDSSEENEEEKELKEGEEIISKAAADGQIVTTAQQE